MTEKLRQEYQRLFDTCKINQNKYLNVASVIEKIANGKRKYDAVENELKIPWFFVAAIHNMEASLNFSRHLHNGDPLTARTKHVPAGRPVKGNPPFTWEESAIDALKLMNLHKWTDWSVPGMLYKLELYNGMGYRKKHPNVLTPYLWSFTNHYTKGKYVADGRWSDEAVSDQVGAAIIIKHYYNPIDLAYLQKTAEIAKDIQKA
jgi:lysozyme family protein